MQAGHQEEITSNIVVLQLAVRTTDGWGDGDLAEGAAADRKGRRPLISSSLPPLARRLDNWLKHR